jgi:hypothetical protein
MSVFCHWDGEMVSEQRCFHGNDINIGFLGQFLLGKQQNELKFRKLCRLMEEFEINEMALKEVNQKIS